MASEAEVNQKRLADELAKPTPDSDVVYYLQSSKPYWNTIDTDKMKRGCSKIYGDSLAKSLYKLATPPIKGKE